MYRRCLVAFLLVPPLSPGLASASDQDEESADDGTYRAAVVGGAEAAPGTWPSIATLIAPASGSYYVRQFCGGALVAAIPNGGYWPSTNRCEIDSFGPVT